MRRLIRVFAGRTSLNVGFVVRWLIFYIISDFIDLFACFIQALCCFKTLSVILQLCLDVAGNSMLTFRVLPRWNIMAQIHDNIPPSHIILTLGWPVLIPISTFLMLSTKWKSSKYHFKSLFMTWLGIEPTTSQSWSGCSINWATVLVSL